LLQLVSKIGFVSGHGFIRAEKSPKNQGFSPWGRLTIIIADIFETRSGLKAVTKKFGHKIFL